MFNWDYLWEAPITLALIGLMLALSLLAFLKEEWRDRMLMVPYDMIAYREYGRLLSSGWIHGDGLHLTFNAITLLFFGSLLEHRLGHWQFAMFYFVALLLSHAAVALRYRKDSGYEGTLGASGAVSAVVLGVVVVNPFLSFGLPILTNLYPFFSVPAWILGSVYLLYSTVSLFIPNPMRINHDAHLWGAVSGILLALILKPQAIDILGQVVAQF